MTPVPDWELPRRDSHPLAQRLASLRHFLAVYASLPPVARRKARLATGLPATALAGLDFHQLDSFERFHPLTWTLPLPSLAWRDEIPIRFTRFGKFARTLGEPTSPSDTCDPHRRSDARHDLRFSG